MRLFGQTIADARAQPRPATVLFGERIEAVVDSASSTAAAGVILPGLIDSHTHPLEIGLQTLFVDMSGAGSIDEVQQRLRDRTREAAEHGMMLGFGLEPDKLQEHRYPDRSDLDFVLPDVPVFVYRVDGHSAVTNTAGLQLLVAGWSAGRVPGVDSDCTGRPTGILRGKAYERSSRLFKHKLLPETVREALRLAGEKSAAQGVTTIGALIGVEDTTEVEWQALLDGLAASAVTAVPYLQTWDVEVPCRFGIKQAGGCLLIDGSFGSRTAALRQDYADARGNAGISYVSDEELLAFLRTAEEAGLQTAVHAIGNRAVEQVVRCHEELGAGPSNPLRHRIEHAELLDDVLIDRIAELGLVLGVQPRFEAEWGGPDRMYRQRLGERWRSTNPYRRLLEHGVVLAGGSDAPITPIDPVAGMRAAMEHPNPTERVTGEQALTMFTSAAAFALNRELTCGSIAAGKDADLTVLTTDPRTAADSRVVATFRSGGCTYKNEALTEYLKLEA